MEEARHMINYQLICPICLETYESPKVLTCLHTFCEKCIRKHVHSLKLEGAQTDTFECPVCRSSTSGPSIDQTPEDWASKRPTNSKILTLLTSGQPGRDDPVYCQPCSNDGKHHISVAYCVMCTEYLCHTCYNCHKNFKISKDHTFTVNTLAENPNANEANDSIYRCSSHNERFTYFCSYHKELCCEKCVINVHRLCVDLSSCQDLAKDIKKREDPKKISENLEALKELFHILLENRSKCLESIQSQKTEITKSMKEWGNAMKSHIDKVEADALQKLEQVCKLETIVISDHIAECKSAIAATDTSHMMLNEGTTFADDTKLFMTIMRISQHVQKYLQRYEVIENDSEEVQIEFRYDKTPKDFIQAWSSVGEVQIKKCRIPKFSSSSSFESSSFSAEVPGDEEVCDIMSGVFLPDDKLVLLDRNNKNLKLFDNKLNFLDQLKMEADVEHICRVDHRTVAVTAGKSVILFSVSHTLAQLRTIYVGNVCYGIASYKENIILDKSDGKDSLVTLDTSYNIINTIQLANFLHPRSTHCISPDGQRIYYTAKDKIVTINMKGEQLNIFESNDLKVAHGITVDKKGIIYCCGMQSSTVVQITPEGRQLGVLLSQDCGILTPYGICLNDRNDTIVVFQGTSDCHVFRLK